MSFHGSFYLLMGTEQEREGKKINDIVANIRLEILALLTFTIEIRKI